MWIVQPAILIGHELSEPSC